MCLLGHGGVRESQKILWDMAGRNSHAKYRLWRDTLIWVDIHAPRHLPIRIPSSWIIHAAKVMNMQPIVDKGVLWRVANTNAGWTMRWSAPMSSHILNAFSVREILKDYDGFPNQLKIRCWGPAAALGIGWRAIDCNHMFGICWFA